MPKDADSANDPSRKVEKPIIELIPPSDEDKPYRDYWANKQKVDAARAATQRFNAAFVKARRERHFGPDVPQPPYRNTHFLAGVNHEDLPDFLR